MSANRKWIAAGVITGLAVIGFGVYKFLAEQVKLLNSYCWKISNVVIVGVPSLTNIHLTIFLKLKNQSDIDVEISDYDLDIYLDGNKVAKVFNKGMKTQWKAKSVSVIQFDVKFNPSEVLTFANISALVGRFLTDKNNLKIRTVGTVSAGHSFIKVKSLPLDITMIYGELMADDDSSYECKID